MSARSLDLFLLAFSGPELLPVVEQARVSGNGSFELYNPDRIRTLSTNNVSKGTSVEGLLYVPDLDQSDPCVNASKPHIPNNATRKADLPTDFVIRYPIIAFAPWISPSCTKSYLAAATGARAFMTYLPDNEATIPPLANNESWDLHDGGQWKAQNRFPVYAIEGDEGAMIMQQMGQYSGDSNDPKIANLLAAEQLDPSDHIRLFASFDTNEASKLPNLWGFLLIILGVVIVSVGVTSFAMHWVQRRRRRDLQRRIRNGEVDLEALGIKSGRVSQEAIDALPSFVYAPSETTPSEGVEQSPSIPVQPSSDPRPNHSQWSQPTCPICLEDFIASSTTVRSLPCHHIYHPECIDPFLREISSLCPVCKAAVLPYNSKDYISVPVTNYMVRLDRRARHMTQDRSSPRRILQERMHTVSGFPTTGEQRVQSVGSAPVSADTTQSAGQIEMQNLHSSAGSVPTQARAPGEITPNVTVPNPDPSQRRDWIRRRLGTLSRETRMTSYNETERLVRRPKWRKVIDKIFPGFR